MTRPLPPLSNRLADHVDAMAVDAASATQTDAAQARLVQALSHATPARRGIHRGVLALASFCAIAVLGMALFLGDQFGNGHGAAFAAVQRYLREFDTLQLQVVQQVPGAPAQRSTVLIDRAGSVRTDVGDAISVIVDARSRQILTLLHDPRIALREPLPAAAVPSVQASLGWLDAIRSFQGEAQPLTETRTIDGIALHGWRLRTAGMQIDLWAGNDGMPRAMALGGDAGLAIDYRFAFDVPVPPDALSAEVPAGYRLEAADGD